MHTVIDLYLHYIIGHLISFMIHDDELETPQGQTDSYGMLDDGFSLKSEPCPALSLVVKHCH